MYQKDPVPMGHFSEKEPSQIRKMGPKRTDPNGPNGKKRGEKMKTQKITLKSKIDNLELECLLTIPDTEIKGIIQLAHGMNEHKERYTKFIEYFAQNGYVCIINDHRGHGKSIKNQEDLGYFYDSKAEAVIEDLYQITEYIKERFPNKKIILFGHSMGSMIVRKYIAKYDDKIDGLIVCGSPSENKSAKLGLVLIKIAELFKGEKYRSKTLKKLMFGGFGKKNEMTNSWICTNKEVVEKYNKDELCIYDYTLNGLENIVRLMIDIYNPKIYKKNNLKLPIYFIAGSDDPVITSIEDWNNAQKFLEKQGYQNISGTLYENMRHEILNEVQNEMVYNDILIWIDKLTKM